MNAHYPALFVGGLPVFPRLRTRDAPYQSPIDLKPPLLVGFFLGGARDSRRAAGVVDRAGAGQPVRAPLYYGAMLLTAFNDNALDHLPGDARAQPQRADEVAVVAGAVAGGGLTVIANAPNPAGQAILGRFFDGGILPVGLLLGALLPTLVATLAFQLL